MSKADDIELQENLLSAPESTSHSNESPPGSYEVSYLGHTITVFPKQWRHSVMVRLQILLCFYMFIVIGMADQTVGALMPTLIKHYSTSQTVVTILFILQFLGYSTSALSNSKLHELIGRRGVLNGGISCLVFSFLINSTAPSLWLYILVHFSFGLGVGLMDSCMNVLLSSLEDHNELMGFLHGFYGVGSMIGPPLVSHILEWSGGTDGFKWHYLTLGVLSLTGLVASYWLFRFETKVKYQYEMSLSDKDDGNLEDEDVGNPDDGGFLPLLKDKMILSFSFYLFLYIGAEISIGSWLLSYLLHIKNLKQIEASYVVSWFWVGLTIGRMLLGFVTKRFKNEYRANLYYSFLSLGSFLLYSIFTTFVTDDFQTVNWLVKVINIVLIVTSGVFVGPLFPTSNVCLMKILPAKLHVSAVGIMTSLGGTGSAILPFSVGALVEVTSFKFFPYYVAAIISGYCFLWLSIPKFSRKSLKYDF